MDTPPDAGAFVRRLEDRIATEVYGRTSVVMAFSGGLASTVVAMVARKRCDLRCVVAGIEDAPDIKAARLGKDFLDYRLKFVLLNRDDVRRLREKVIADFGRLPRDDLEAFVPLRAVLERIRGRPVLSGFGCRRLHPGMSAALERAGVSTPLRDAALGHDLPRAILQSAATTLGLPREWANAFHRAPAKGAGVENFLRESGAAR